MSVSIGTFTKFDLSATEDPDKLEAVKKACLKPNEEACVNQEGAAKESCLKSLESVLIEYEFKKGETIYILGNIDRFATIDGVRKIVFQYNSMEYVHDSKGKGRMNRYPNHNMEVSVKDVVEVYTGKDLIGMRPFLKKWYKA